VAIGIGSVCLLSECVQRLVSPNSEETDESRVISLVKT